MTIQEVLNSIQEKMLDDHFISPTQFEEIAKIMDKVQREAYGLEEE